MQGNAMEGTALLQIDNRPPCGQDAKEKDMNKIEAMALAGEQEGGADVVEYVVTLGIAIGLGAILVAFRDKIGDVIEDAGTKMTTLFNNVTSGLTG